MNRKYRKTKGFTLIEVIVVTLIIAMLAVFVVPKLTKKLGKAKTNIAKGQIGMICSALEDFILDCDRFPSSEEGLDALVTEPESMVQDKWDGEYISEKKIIDPWGNKFGYILEDGEYTVFSYGPDGQQGTEDDVTNE